MCLIANKCTNSLTSKESDEERSARRGPADDEEPAGNPQLVLGIVLGSGGLVMAFWGAPVDIPNHAQLAVKCAIEMTDAVRKINEEHRAKGIPEIGMGIGLNTGTMCVGDMGSELGEGRKLAHPPLRRAAPRAAETPYLRLRDPAAPQPA